MLTLGVAGSLLAIFFGSPALGLMVAPAVMVSVVGPALYRRPEPEVEVGGPVRVVEGDRVELTVEVRSAVSIPWLHIALELPPDLEPADGVRHAVITVPAGRRATVRFPVRAVRWGVAVPGRVELVARDRFGLFISSAVHRPRLAMRVHPADGNRRSVMTPRRLRVRVGDHRSRRHGDGADFAEVRPYRPGDRVRSHNWRVSARRGEPWVTIRHPDRSGDLVFLLDSFHDVGPDGNRLVQRAVRAAMALADSNLAAHDRVGLLDVGRRIRWFRPRDGRLQQARLFDGLLETQVEPGLRAPTVDLLPLTALGGSTMIVVLTGLIEEEMSLLPIALRDRGLEVVVIECAVDRHLPTATDRSEALAMRLWRLQRLRRRARLWDHGVTVVPWDDEPLELVVAGLAHRTGSPA